MNSHHIHNWTFLPRTHHTSKLLRKCECGRIEVRRIIHREEKWLTNEEYDALIERDGFFGISA